MRRSSRVNLKMGDGEAAPVFPEFKHLGSMRLSRNFDTGDVTSNIGGGSNNARPVGVGRVHFERLGILELLDDQPIQVTSS
jgi:hypothetical protein